MKFSKAFKIGIATLTCALAFSSCQIGGGTITFDSNGAGYDPQPVSLNNGTYLNDLPIMSKIGYDFVGWCYDKELTKLAYAPVGMGIEDFTLYAKYKIDEDQFINQTLTWTNGASLDYACNAYTASHLLLNMLPSLGSLGKIILGSPISSQSYEKLRVCDYNGKVIPDKNPASHIWEPASPIEKYLPDGATYQQFVIEISTSHLSETTIHLEIA
ncbi:MAG: hypothetical protein E7349_03130 [Clostridiales bacterium]|nr:hypothetical protein [Clostridiales bacterium]